MRGWKEVKHKHRFELILGITFLCLLCCVVVVMIKTYDRNEKDHLEGSKINNEDKSSNTEMEVVNLRNNEVEIHGAYFSASSVSTLEKVEKIISDLKGTKINAVVIDVKDDYGEITFPIGVPLAEGIGAISEQIHNVKDMLQLFHKNGIYVIGRIVAFRDDILTGKRPDYAVKCKDGSIFLDRANHAWLNPYNQNCWLYLISIGKAAAEMGFDEIQFDYVRFSTEMSKDKVSLDVDMSQYSKTQVITDFIQYAVRVLHEYKVAVSADVFGSIIHSELDSSIVGQDYVELSRYLDYICPMIYPSHYADGCFGIAVPDLEPYQLIYEVLQDSNEELSILKDQVHCAKVRPWLQDFTARWKKKFQPYGTQQVNDQIQGVYDSGCSQWLLWNSSGRYSVMKQMN